MKDAAYQFLKELERRLNQKALPPDIMKSRVDTVWKKPDEQKTEREKLESKENVPFFYFAAPQIFELGKSIANLTDEKMREAFRCVYYGKFPELSASNVCRKKGHPFAKDWYPFAEDSWKMSPRGIKRIMDRWQKQPTATPANQAWPEAGLSTPFPFKIVFEAKYFEAGSLDAAQRELVKGVYQTVFYRGLPTSDDWGYDFGCLLAYDVSQGANLKAAWDSVACKHLFWDHAHVFVMIVRGSENEPSSLLA